MLHFNEGKHTDGEQSEAKRRATKGERSAAVNKKVKMLTCWNQKCALWETRSQMN